MESRQTKISLDGPKKTGDALIVIGTVLSAFALAGFVLSKSIYWRPSIGRGEIPHGIALILLLSFTVGVGLLSSGLLSNHRR